MKNALKRLLALPLRGMIVALDRLNQKPEERRFRQTLNERGRSDARAGKLAQSSDPDYLEGYKSP